MMDTAFPEVPKLAVAFGSRTLSHEKILYAESSIPDLIKKKKSKEKRIEKRKELKKFFETPNFPSRRKLGKESVLIDSSLPSPADQSPSPLPSDKSDQKLISDIVKEDYKKGDEDDDEDDEEDEEDEMEQGNGQVEKIIMKREMMFANGKRYFRGAVGLLIQGSYRQSIFSSTLLSPIDKPKMITGTSEKLRIEDEKPLKFLSKLAAQYKSPTLPITKYSFFCSIIKKNNGEVIRKPIPKPVGSDPYWWSSDTSFLNVGDKVQFYVYNGEKGLDQLMEEMKNAPVDYSNAGSLIFSSNIEPEFVGDYYHDDYRDHSSFQEIEENLFGDDEEEAENEEEVEEFEVVDDDDDDDHHNNKPPVIEIDLREKIAREVSLSDIEQVVKESLIAQSKIIKEDESDEEFEHTFYDRDFKIHEKVEKEEAPLQKNHHCDEVTRINQTFDSLPTTGIYGVCNFTLPPKSPVTPSFISSTVVVFEPPK